MTEHLGVKMLSLRQLFTEDKQYVVPIYQRNYEWGEIEIVQLLDDIKTAHNQARENDKQKNYYIGSLVLAQNGECFEVIDGQQRLTTLCILRKVCEEQNRFGILSEVLGEQGLRLADWQKMKLDYQHRKPAEHALNGQQDAETDENIRRGFQIIREYLRQLGDDIGDWIRFCLNRVHILYSEVAAHTDLNRYFEIMNTRRQQLEKHEVLKARLMAKLDRGTREQAVFAQIWDACADMDRFAVAGFPVDMRQPLFGEDACSIPQFEQVGRFLPDNRVQTDRELEEVSMADLLQSSAASVKHENSVGKIDGRAASIIDFSNFLLQVLAVYRDEIGGKHETRLDDKFLLEQFECLEQGGCLAIKQFAETLLACRLLFDRYVLKTNFEQGNQQSERWRMVYWQGSKDGGWREVPTFPKQDSSTAEIVMLQSMFHVSYSSKTYKQWLKEVLHYLLKQRCSNIRLEAEEYAAWLRHLAYRFYQNDCRKAGLDKWEYGNTPHYVFNYLDYLIWRAYGKGDKALFPEVCCDKAEDLKKGLADFEFFNRSSVEHYYPQNPDFPGWNQEKFDIDSLGNLCLISHSSNAGLSNNHCDIKREQVLARLRKYHRAESCKQMLMLMYREWSAESAADHECKMTALLNQAAAG